ncbi:N-acetylated-alpha-linked acidic dipeptidase 2-like [Centruroides sculpturatus]|uniref:N-acetylated-alpha-linked acidic dipeptidase 2-like n=1 Tax=Centruroides sculpturatus TaxID=218467 RepID=UPI000C6CAFED|nr:N-acetylated-alpha-linked acidic dipeptidase 2-like [Centruroides sculpturatus]
MTDYIRGKKAYTKWDVETENVDMDIPPDAQQPHVQIASEGWFSGRKGKVLKVLFLVSLFFIGLIFGYFIRRGVHEVILKKENTCPQSSALYSYQKQYVNLFQDNVDPVKIGNNLRYFTQEVHRAGSDESLRIAEFIRDKWKEFGLNSVRIEKYNVLLSVPSMEVPNKVYLIDKNGKLVFSASESGDGAMFPEMRPYYAYSPKTEAQGKLVYAHYGRLEDFEYLKKVNVSVENAVVIMRNGKTHRGSKIKLAEKFGAVAALLYPDPIDHGGGSLKTYPENIGLPGDGVVRGNLKTYPGDPNTPFLPSVDGVYRIPLNEIDLPRIPSQPISYNDAQVLMKNLGGPEAPSDWKGMLNISYNLGSEFLSNKTNASFIKVEVFNELQQKEVYNVIATIPGQFEPGRYVIIGGHHDSWTNGSADPGTGVAVLLELSRVFGILMKEGWKPGRSLILASWDAEEFGITGSMEWIQDHAKELFQRTIAYINVDIVVTGNYSLQVLASPLLRQALKEASTDVSCHDPNHPGMSLYDMWKLRRPQDKNSANSIPLIDIPGSGSDFVGFISGLGIPSAHLQFVGKDMISDYPLYHTSYDTFDAVANYTDVNFKMMTTMTHMLGAFLMKLTDSLHLPMVVSHYSDQLKRDFAEFSKNHEKLLQDHGISLDNVTLVLKSFEEACKEFHNNFKTIGDRDLYLEAHEYNDRLIAIEHSFLLPDGVSSSSYLRHVIYGPDFKNNYNGIIFPFLSKAMFDAQENNTSENWNLVNLQLSYVNYALRSAIGVLESHVLMGNSKL